MSSKEFLERFEVLYNNILSNAAPGLNSYEISIFLTKGQDELLKNYFNPLGNKYKEGFDSSPKRLIDFSKVIKIIECAKSTSALSKLDNRSLVFKLPSDILFILNETLYTTDSSLIQAVPISFIDYSSLMKKPFKYPHKSEAWRLLSLMNEESTQIEIITSKIIDRYLMRYVRKVKPIIVGDLSEYDVSINGYTSITECELDEELHEEILLRAVELSKNAYTGDLTSTIQLGLRSE